MIWLELLVLAAVIGAGFAGYKIGHRDGYKDGWFDGHQHATWRFLPPTHVQPYDFKEQP